MSIMPDHEIERRCKNTDKPMIEPFVSSSIKVRNKMLGDKVIGTTKLISYGLSSYGYDVRLGESFKIFTNVHNGMVDPKKLNNNNYVDHNGPECIIPPNSFILGVTAEKFNIPRDCLGIVIGKSTYARCGLIVNVTPLEPEWEGHVTLEISNTTPLPAKVYANEGIAQVYFLMAPTTARKNLYPDSCKVSYGDRKGKYQQQAAEIVLPKL